MAEKRAKDIGMVMTVSLFLILLTFFILLNSIAVLDDNRTRMALGSLIGAFGGLPGGLSPLATGESILPPTAPMLDEELSMEQLLEYMNRNSATPMGFKVTPVKDGKKITINEKNLFTKDRSRINPSPGLFLDRLGRLIKRGDFPVDVVGHTDAASPQIKGYQSNWELSTHMALKVLKYFVSEYQIAPERLTAYGSGSYRPIASNESVHPDYVQRIFKKKPSGFFTYKKFDFKLF